MYKQPTERRVPPRTCLDDTWVAAHRDVAYYFKAPQAFLLAGLRDEAAAAFERSSRSSALAWGGRPC